MGAFGHLQEETKAPFGINIELPSLNVQHSSLDFPMPLCPSMGAPEPAEGPSEVYRDQWEGIMNVLERNPQGFPYDPREVSRVALWESNEDYFSIPAFLNTTIEEAEKGLLNYADSYMNIPEPPIGEKTLISALKHALLGVVSRFFVKQDNIFSISSNFRLLGHCLKLTQNSVKAVLKSANQYLYITKLIEEYSRRADSLLPAYASGLHEFCIFYQSYILSLTDELTLLQFIVQTDSVREHLKLLYSLSVELTGLSGSELVDSLYNFTVYNDADFNNSLLFRMLFSRTVKPYLCLLTNFVYSGETEDSELLVLSEPNNERPTLLPPSVQEQLTNIKDSLCFLRELDGDLAVYFTLCSSGRLSSLENSEIAVPRLKILFESGQIQQQLDHLTEFQAVQMRGLMELEKLELVEKERLASVLLEKKLARISQQKQVSALNMALERQKAETTRKRQWEYYFALNRQLEENRELKRIEQEKLRKEEDGKLRKEQEKQQKLIEQGKQALLEEYQGLLEALYIKTAKDN